MSDLDRRKRSLRRTHVFLIVTGIPLAVVLLGVGILGGGIYGICAVMGTYTAMMVAELINEGAP